jgi:hypothetical protein
LTDIIGSALRVADLGSREVRNWDLALVDLNRALWPTQLRDTSRRKIFRRRSVPT